MHPSDSLQPRTLLDLHEERRKKGPTGWRKLDMRGKTQRSNDNSGRLESNDI